MRLRAFAQIECFESGFSATRDFEIGFSLGGKAVEEPLNQAREKSLMLDWLKEARQLLPEAVLLGSYGDYLKLVRLFSILQPEESLQVFEEAARLIDKAISKEKKGATNNGLVDFQTAYLPKLLVENSFDSIRVMVNELNVRELQVSMHLGLLSRSISVYGDEMKKQKSSANEAQQVKKQKL